jgi:hypothetical protein
MAEIPHFCLIYNLTERNKRVSVPGAFCKPFITYFIETCLNYLLYILIRSIFHVLYNKTFFEKSTEPVLNLT